MKDVVIPPELDGARVDKVVVQLVSGSSRASVKRAIEDGRIWVNGRPRAKGAVVAAGEVLSYDESDLLSSDTPATPDPDAFLKVVLETKQLIVLDKPAGQPCAPIKVGEKGTLANALVAKYPELAGVGYNAREPGLVHRLDTDTSGLVLAARTANAFEALRDALQSEKLVKSYLLVCESANIPDEGDIQFPLANHPKDQKRVLACIHPRDVMRNAPRPALTRFTVEQRGPRFALVRAHAAKALRHQIRAHFSAFGAPLAGDALYGGPAIEGLTRHALHAATLSLTSKAEPEFTFSATSELPEELARLLTLA
ncbi:MAG: pseudouridine synthase [Polyangiaceae bacterium]